SSARSIVSRSVMSPRSVVTDLSCSGLMISSRRRGSEPRSKATTGTRSSTSVRTVHAPMQPSAPVTRKRSLMRPSCVLVDGDDLRVELERGATLLVGPEAGPLDPAERDVHIRAGGLRVHVQDPSLELVDEA